MAEDKNLNLKQLLALVLIPAAALFILATPLKTLGWGLYGLGFLATLLGKDDFRKHISLIYLSLGLLGQIPITTEINNENFFRMGTVLGVALALPYLVSRFIYKERVVRFSFSHGRRWLRREFLYIGVTAFIAYLLLPIYLLDTGAYQNWSVERTGESIFRLFIGTNALGIWDELFFVSTVLGIFRRYLNFSWANALQAVVFTSFLYDLGFTGWAPFVLYPFALIQGYIFKQTDSLIYVITIHLTLDFILFLALINAHHPDLANIFFT